MFILDLARKLDGQQSLAVDYNALLGRYSTETTVRNTEIGLTQTGAGISVHAFLDGVVTAENCEIVALNSNNHEMVEAMVLTYAQHHHDTNIAATIKDVAAIFPGAQYSELLTIPREEVRFTAGQYSITVSRDTDSNTYSLEVWDTENINMALNGFNIKSNRVVLEALTKIVQIAAQSVML